MSAEPATQLNPWVAPLCGLAGVLVGFLLGWAKEAWRANSRKKELQLALGDEMTANLKMLPQKKDILAQCLEHLAQNQFLSPSGLRFDRTIFSQHWAELAGGCSLIERGSFHVIYEKMRVFDEETESLDTQAVATPTGAGDILLRNMAKRLPDMMTTLDQLDFLMSSHLDGKPVDVMHHSLSKEQVAASFAMARMLEKRSKTKGPIV